MDSPEQKSIALSQTERDIVCQFMEQIGSTNFSAALRQIIREWAKAHNIEIKTQPIAEQQ